MQNKGTILIVDDEPHVLLFMTKVFQPMGYGTLTAQSGDEAMRYFEECSGSIDLVLTDLKMSGMSGMEVLERIRSGHSEVPVVVMSAYHEKEEECLRLGAAAFVKKPYSLEDLVVIMEKIVGEHPQHEAMPRLEDGIEPAAKILIVDDEIEVTKLIGETFYEDFPEADFKIRCAQSGHEAMKICDEFQPDIAIIDIKMPGMSGDDLIRRLKAGEGYCPRDFVIYTSVTDPAVIQRAQDLGHKILMKPTNIETLYEVIKRICARHHLLKKAAS